MSDCKTTQGSGQEDEPGPAKARPNGFVVLGGVNVWFALIAIVALAIVAVVILLPSPEPFQRMLQLIKAIQEVVGQL